MWAVPSLDALLGSGIEVAAAVTAPDKPAGRGMKLRAPAVKEHAAAAGIEVWQPERARDPALRARLGEVSPDVAVVVAYGKILPAELLEVPRLGFVNVHFSLLPSYRGAAPVQRAVIDGAPETGVSIMLLTEGMDEGPVLARRATPIGERETAGEVGARLARLGADLIVPTLEAYARGDLAPEPQDDARATYAPKVGDDDAHIDWARPAEDIANLVRGCNPNPGAWTELEGRRMKIYRATRYDGDDVGRLTPGALAGGAGALVAGTADRPLELREVQLAGKRRMTGDELARGLRDLSGRRLG